MGNVDGFLLRLQADLDHCQRAAPDGLANDKGRQQRDTYAGFGGVTHHVAVVDAQRDVGMDDLDAAGALQAPVGGAAIGIVDAAVLLQLLQGGRDAHLREIAG